MLPVDNTYGPWPLSGMYRPPFFIPLYCNCHFTMHPCVEWTGFLYPRFICWYSFSSCNRWNRHYGSTWKWPQICQAVRRFFVLLSNALNPRTRGTNWVRGSLNWGPVTWLNAVAKTFGAWPLRRGSYDKDFHTYALEWDENFMCVI